MIYLVNVMYGVRSSVRFVCCRLLVVVHIRCYHTTPQWPFWASSISCVRAARYEAVSWCACVPLAVSGNGGGGRWLPADAAAAVAEPDSSCAQRETGCE